MADDLGAGGDGRRVERDRLVHHLREAGTRAGVVRGEAGIGKTRLLAGVLASLAAERRVLSVRLAETDRQFAYGALTALLDDQVVEQHASALPTPRGRVLEALLLRADLPGPIEPPAVGMAVGELLRHLAGERPLVLAIDDVQWCDESTVAALRVALRRLAGADVAVLVAVRSDPADGTESWKHWLPVDGVEVTLAGLPVAALSAAVEQHVGHRLPRSHRLALHELTRGNPMLALELAAVLDREGVLLRPGLPPPVPADLARLVGARLDQADQDVRRVLELVGLAGRLDEGVLARTREVSDEAVRSARALGLLERAGGLLRPSHPLLGAVAAGELAPTERRRLHGALAAAVTDPAERAHHLALSTAGPDEGVAAELDRASVEAGRRGALRVAAELALAAADLTAEAAGHRDRQLRAARACLDAGDVHEAAGRAGTALASSAGEDRVAPLLLLGELAVCGGDRHRAATLAHRAATAAGSNPLGRARAHAALAQWSDDHVDTESRAAEAVLVALAGHEAEAPGLVGRALCILAFNRFLRGGGADTPAFVRATHLVDADPGVAMVDHPADVHAQVLGCLGRFADARTLLTGLLERASRAGSELARPTLLARLVMLSIQQGQLRAASEGIDEALALADDLDLPLAGLRTYRHLLDALTGRDAAAFAAASAEADRATEHGDDWLAALYARAAGVAALTAGDDAAAAHRLGQTLSTARRFGVTEPAWFRVGGDLVEALVGAGRLEEAEAHAGELAESAARTGIGWTALVAVRSEALLAGARADPAAASAACDEALRIAPSCGSPYEEARTRTVAAAVARRARQKAVARTHLAAAASGFDQAGAVTWARRARRDLGRLGAPAGPLQLSGAEQRVVDLAASGRTNGEIAGALFVSVRTVESHLGSAYRKLGVRSRTELAARLRPLPTDP